MDQLEIDLFLPACALRLRQLEGARLEHDEVAARIRLMDEQGGALPGAAGRYHSHAFHPDAVQGDVPNAILAADLMVRDRASVTLALVEAARGRAQRQRRDLPVH